MDIKGKVAVVTGGASGIGQAVTRRIAATASRNSIGCRTGRMNGTRSSCYWQYEDHPVI